MKLEDLTNEEYAGVERRSVPRVLPYHPDDTRTWLDAGRKLIFTTERHPSAGYLRVVFCEIIGPVPKWVSWYENIADSERVGHPATFDGDYYDDLKEGIDLFFARVARYGVKVLVP